MINPDHSTASVIRKAMRYDIHCYDISFCHQ